MRLILLGTAGCHLCEEAEAVVASGLLQAGLTRAVEPVDIAERPEWQLDYALKIPVLLEPESGRELAWPFEAEQVSEFLANSASGI